MSTLKPQGNGPLHSTTVIGTLVVDGLGGLLHLVQRGGAWAGCGPAHMLRPLLAEPNVTAHTSTASVPTSYYSMWHRYLCTLKGEYFDEIGSRVQLPLTSCNYCRMKYCRVGCRSSGWLPNRYLTASSLSKVTCKCRVFCFDYRNFSQPHIAYDWNVSLTGMIAMMRLRQKCSCVKAV